MEIKFDVCFTQKGNPFLKLIDLGMFGCFKVKINVYTYVLRMKEDILQYRSGMRVDLEKSEGLDLRENKEVAVFMALY